MAGQYPSMISQAGHDDRAPLIMDPPQWDSERVLQQMRNQGKPADESTQPDEYSNLPELQSKL